MKNYKNGTKGYIITKGTDNMGFELKTYLENKLIEQFNNKYDSYYHLYFIGEEANLNGHSYFNSQFGVYFKGHEQGTLPHEAMHALNLPHTFDGIHFSDKYTYEACKTNNLLDYSHKVGIKRHCTYLWQWNILNPKIQIR